jgi:trehalose-phosphatase
VTARVQHPRPAHLFATWPAIARRLGRADRLALFTDFDGTLVPIRRHAADVRLSPRVRRLLADLAAAGVLVGVISGRALADVRARVRLGGMWYVGSHGFLLCAPNGHTVVLATLRQRQQIARVTRRLRTALAAMPGLEIDQKVATVAVHYRNASGAVRRAGARVLTRFLADEGNLRLLPGKKVWEILPAAPFDKAGAVQFILQEAEQRAARARWLAVYVGDDVTDERVFARWRGLSVVVGRRSRTAATYYLRSPAEVRTLLNRLRRLELGSRRRTLTRS